MAIDRLNPPALHSNPAFVQVIAATNVTKLVFVGGQNSVDVAGNIVGSDLHTQTAQCLRNVLSALAAAGADQRHVVRLAVYVKQDQQLSDAFAAAREIWGEHATAITVLVVSALANPAFLVEIEAIAAL